MKVVFDSSTLILLAKIDLLREIAEEHAIIVPVKVKEECLRKESPDALLIKALITEKKVDVKKAGSPDAVGKLQRDFRIEAAEAEALWLAKRLDCPIAVDDGPTIKACKVMGRRFATAIHFLLDLASRGKLARPMAFAKLEKISTYGRYSRKIIEDTAKRLKGGS